MTDHAGGSIAARYVACIACATLCGCAIAPRHCGSDGGWGVAAIQTSMTVTAACDPGDDLEIVPSQGHSYAQTFTPLEHGSVIYIDVVFDTFPTAVPSVVYLPASPDAEPWPLSLWNTVYVGEIGLASGQGARWHRYAIVPNPYFPVLPLIVGPQKHSIIVTPNQRGDIGTAPCEACQGDCYSGGECWEDDLRGSGWFVPPGCGGGRAARDLAFAVWVN